LLNPTNQKRDLHIFALIFGLLGVYISSAFIRLELFSSLALILLGSVGLSLLTKEIFKPARQETKKPIKSHPITIKISFLVVITIFLIVPMMVPVSANWVNGAKAPPTILNGGSNYNIATTDWLDAMQWLKENTPKDAVVASWWDYGYWITTLGERKSLVDNATLDTEKIKKISKVLLSSPDESWMLLNDGAGIRGYSYVFDGVNDYVDFQETEFITKSNSLTMNVWIKTSNPYHQVIMSNTNNEQIFELGVNYPDNLGQPYLLIQDVSGDKKIQVADTIVTDNEWHMITVIFDQDDDRLQIFVDGENEKNGHCLDCTFNKEINHNAQKWTLGKNSENKFWNGKIDDLSFWNRPLTNNEIKTLYNQNKGIDAREVGIDALLAFYDFEGQTLNNQIHQNYDVRGYYNDIALGSSSDGINYGVHVGNRSLDADYVLIYVAAQRVNSEEPPLYFVQGGGDESKKQWFMKIGGFDTQRFLYDDGLSSTPEFWNDTLLGKMIPFTVFGYIDVASQQQSQSYVSGFTPVYVDDIKFPKNSDGPFRLAYMSPGFMIKNSGAINGVLIYEVNKDYTPTETPKAEPIISTESTPTETSSSGQIATISTNFGDIVIELKPEIAPKTVENFVKLTDSKFYDGTLFHRIISTFVIQGGDPNTKDQPPGTWGTGGPGYSIDAEISNLKHTKYMVSMARGTDINSAGSQFFIMTGDAPFLDGKYTIFGEVIEGKDVVDKIASLQTDLNDRPVDFEAARMSSVRIS
jgi:cyclophilin family peptidyl-prolyl cis-trans isomerase